MSLELKERFQRILLLTGGYHSNINLVTFDNAIIFAVMDAKWITIMQRQKRLKLGFSDLLTHYFIVPGLLVVPSINLYDLCSLCIFHTYKGDNSAWEMCLFSLPFLLLALCFYVIQSRSLKFKRAKIKQSAAEFKEAIERTAKQLDWRIEHKNNHFARAYRGWNWENSLGEMITIIRTDHDILINSICDPAYNSIISYGWNRKNVMTFLRNLQDVTNGVLEVQNDTEKPEKEWTLLKILSRIVLYPLCIGLVLLTLLVLIPSGGGALYGIGASVYAITYLYTDIKMILKNKIGKASS